MAILLSETEMTALRGRVAGDVHVEEMTTTNVLGQEAAWEQRGDQWT